MGRVTAFPLQAGQSIEQQLPFWARSVLVDNPGGRYIQVPAAGLVVPPYTGGSAAPLVAATTVARANTTPPTGLNANESGQPATLQWTDELLSTSAGTYYAQLAAANAFSAQFGGAASTTLTFWASTIKVENPGGTWLNITTPAGIVTVPPFTGGRVIALGQQTKTVTITTAPPAGQTNTLAGAAPVITYTDLVLPESSGAPAGQNLTPTVVGTIAQVFGTGPNPAAATFAVSDGTQLTMGQLYDLVAIIGYVSGNANAVAQTIFTWTLTYGGGNGLVLGAGVLGIPASNIAPTGINMPLWDQRITGVGGAHFTLTITSQTGNNFALNSVNIAFQVLGKLSSL